MLIPRKLHKALSGFGMLHTRGMCACEWHKLAVDIRWLLQGQQALERYDARKAAFADRLLPQRSMTFCNLNNFGIHSHALMFVSFDDSKHCSLYKAIAINVNVKKVEVFYHPVLTQSKL